MKVYIEPIGRLINEFSKLPGVGAKTAQRFAYKVVNMNLEEAKAFSDIQGLNTSQAPFLKKLLENVLYQSEGTQQEKGRWKRN